MAISVGASAQRATQAPAQPIKAQTQASKGDAAKTDLAPGIKQAAQIAACPAGVVAGAATQAASQAVGALVNTKA